MNDRELLEFAAIAAKSVSCDGIEIGKWNPLEDDGDALRLAAMLDLDILFYRKHVNVFDATRGQNYFTEDFTTNNNSKIAATRRAIVRAAAKIGRAK